MFHAAEVFIIRLLVIVALVAGVWWLAHTALGQRDQLVLQNATGVAQAGARTAETSAATEQAQAATQALQTGVRAGQAISRASRVVAPPAAGQPQPMIGNDTLRNIVGQGR